MKLWVWITVLALLSRLGAAQQAPAPKGPTIAGRLLEQGSDQPLPYVTVNLLDAAQQLVAGGISDERGGFRLDAVPPGAFTLEFRFIGYQVRRQPVQVGSGAGRLDLGTLRLQPEATQLREVTVQGERAAVSLQLDKKVFEVGKDLLSQGGSANDVLGGVPSVTVGPTGGLSLRDNPNVTVLVNGRRSGLSQTNSLDQIPASQIERVEVITNPSARYDAAGSAGIINVVLKKNRQQGLSGQVRLVGGLPNDTRLTPSLSYKAGKLNAFGTAGLRLSDYRGRYRTEQVTGLQDQPLALQQRQRENRHDDGRVLYLGADYYLSERQTLTASFLKNDTRDHDQTWLDYRYARPGAAPDSLLHRHGESWEQRSYQQLDASYARQFAQPGRKLTVEAQYDFWDSDKTWQLSTRRLPDEPRPGLRTRAVGASRDLVVQSDLVQPLGGATTLELGLKAERRTVSSDFRAEQQRGPDWLVFRGIANRLQYQELIGSAYGQLGRKAGKLGYQLGLRTELTRIGLDDRVGDFRRRKHYQRLFPSANLRYAFSEAASLQLSYSRRINRPSLWLLFPFNELTDLNAQELGNPDLDPAYGHVLELGLLRSWGPLTLNPALYYQHNTGVIQTYVYRDAAGVFISFPVNLPQETRRGLELSVLYNPAKWLQINGELNAYAFTQRGHYQGQDLGVRARTLTSRLNTQLKLPARLGVQVRYNFTGAQRTAQTRTAALHTLNLALSQGLLGGKATLVLDATNVLNSSQIRTRTNGPDYVFSQVSQRDAARFRLSLTYRFNPQEGQTVRQAKSSNRE
jgi:outer membrane receptor protein involved in Fe transport